MFGFCESRMQSPTQLKTAAAPVCAGTEWALRSMSVDKDRVLALLEGVAATSQTATVQTAQKLRAT